MKSRREIFELVELQSSQCFLSKQGTSVPFNRLVPPTHNLMYANIVVVHSLYCEASPEKANGRQPPLCCFRTPSLL